MNARAVWTSLAALLTASFGFSLSLFSRPSIPWGRWLLICVFAGAASAVRLISVRGSSRGNATRGRWDTLLTFGSGIVSLAALALLGYGTGSWLAFAIGGPALIGLTTVVTIIGLKLSPYSSVDPAAPTWLPSTVHLAIDLVLFALFFPLVGFTGGGSRLGLYPWAVSVALVVSSLVFLVAIYPDALRIPEAERRYRRDRPLTLGLTLLNLVGVLIAGSFFAGSPEARLLGIAPAMVVAFTAMAAPLHPSAADGRRIAKILVPTTYLSLIAAFALIYALT